LRQEGRGATSNDKSAGESLALLAFEFDTLHRSSFGEASEASAPSPWPDVFSVASVTGLQQRPDLNGTFSLLVERIKSKTHT
jgi:hypothetical protein